MEKELAIDGMKCSGCVKRVENALKELKEIKKIEVSLEEKKAKISLKKDIDDKILIDIIECLGFKVIEVK